MALTPGTRLGAYEIVSLLGKGGMGEVYRARDTKLDRDVAIKVLPELFVSDPERVARFQREAKTLASLNHPHIGGIYGFEDTDGVRALVLELVEGPTLADRIAQGLKSIGKGGRAPRLLETPTDFRNGPEHAKLILLLQVWICLLRRLEQAPDAFDRLEANQDRFGERASALISSKEGRFVETEPSPPLKSAVRIGPSWGCW